MTEIRVPRLNANDDEVEVLALAVESGAAVVAGQHIGDVGTTKTAVLIEAPAAGFVHWRHDVGATVRVGDVLADLTDSAVAPVRTAPVQEPASPSNGPEGGAPRRLIKKGGPRPEAGAGVAGASLGRAGLERVPLDRVKREEVKILTRTASIPTSSVTSLALGRVEPQTLGPLLHGVARALAQHPGVNAFFDDGDIWRHEHVRLGVAMDLGRGLRVVAIDGVASLNVDEIDARLRAAGERYLADALTPEDLAAPGLVVTDLRMFGVASFTPLLGERQGAILGVSGGAMAGTPLALTLVFDHRVMAGRDAGMFLADLVDTLPADSAPAQKTHEPFVGPSIDHCDRCWISLSDYYRTVPRDAMMTLYLRADGTMGAMCHVCANG